MNNQQGVVNAVYTATDAWAMAQYGANSAATYTPVRRIDDAVVAAGNWLGTRKKIFFVRIYNDERGEVFETKFTPLFKLASQSDVLSSEELFNVYVNIIRLVCPGKDLQIQQLFTSRGYDVILLDTIQTKIWYHNSKLVIRHLAEVDAAELPVATREALEQAQLENEQTLAADSADLADDELALPPEVLSIVLGVYFNLITKKITTLNIDNWYKGRLRAYSRNTQQDHSESLFNNARPSVKFAEAVNSGVAGCFKFKRLVFKLVQEFSSIESHPLHEVAKITMGYYRMAELTSFSMVVEYILTQNPVLLSWNGVNKYLAYFKAALDKFRSLGPEGPYCKLLYPPEELTEFKGERIGILTNIAHDIATYEGRSTLANLRGVSTYPLPAKTIATIRRIINLYSGAITHSVAHARVGGFARLDPNTLLAEALNSPAKEDDTQDPSTKDPKTIPGVDPVVVN